MTLEDAKNKLDKLNPDRILRLINSQENPKPIVFFDLETTGAKPETAKICSISVIKIHLDGSKELKHKIVNPGIVMSDEVIAIHGISNEEAQKEPTFHKYAKGFAEFIKGCDFAGFNSAHFDKPILAREFESAGIDWAAIFSQAKFIDVSNIYRHFNRRRLIDAVMRYLNVVMSDAHSSAFDSIATMEVFEMMLIEHENEIPKAMGDMERILIDNLPLDVFGKIYLDKDKAARFNFGKHKDKTVESVLGPGGEDVNYYSWMTKQGFHPITMKVISDLNNSFRSPTTPPMEHKKPQGK